LLKTRTYSVLVILAVMSLAAAAPAANGGGRSASRVGLGDATPVDAGPLTRPAESFRRVIRIGVRRIRAARRAGLRRRRREAFTALPAGVTIETLDAIGSCESGGDPTAVSADGSYRGKYQFDYGTWESVGGSGDPAAASELEQDYRAALLYSRSGSSPWPVCG
jgi:Transglycosylase-like domain